MARKAYAAQVALLARLKVAVGDTLRLIEEPGGYRLSPGGPACETQMAEARRIMGAHRDALRDLARSARAMVRRRRGSTVAGPVALRPLPR